MTELRGGDVVTGFFSIEDYEKLARDMVFAGLADLKSSDVKAKEEAEVWFKDEDEEYIFSYRFIKNYFCLKDDNFLKAYLH